MAIFGYELVWLFCCVGLSDRYDDSRGDGAVITLGYRAVLAAHS